MRRLLVLAFLLFAAMSLSASVGFGWSVAPVGSLSPSGEAYGALSLAVAFSPYVEGHYGDIIVEASIVPVSPWLENASARIETPLFLLRHHPFSFIFPNPVYWAPRVSLGAEYRMVNDWYLRMGVSPLCFQDNEYVWEFLSPYALYDIKENRWGWGCYIMRFSYFIGGVK